MWWKKESEKKKLGGKVKATSWVLNVTLKNIDDT